MYNYMNAQSITNALHGVWHGRYGTARCSAHDTNCWVGDNDYVLKPSRVFENARFLAMLPLVAGLWQCKDLISCKGRE